MSKAKTKAIEKKDSKAKTKTIKKSVALDYSKNSKTGEQAVGQKVIPFGTDKQSLKAKASYVIAQFLFVNKKMEQFNAMTAKLVILEQTGQDLEHYYYNKDYSGSTLHEGLHAISKAETEEVGDDKDGNPTDSFARGKRQLITKAKKVGIKSLNDFYTPTAKYAKSYQKITPAQLKTACEYLISAISEERKTNKKIA